MILSRNRKQPEKKDIAYSSSFQFERIEQISNRRTPQDDTVTPSKSGFIFSKVLSIFVLLAPLWALEWSRLANAAQNEPDIAFLVGKRIQAIGVLKGKEVPIQIVRLTENFVVYRELESKPDSAKQAPSPSRNIRLDTETGAFDEIRSDNLVWKLVSTPKGRHYQGPVIPAATQSPLKLDRELNWESDQLIRLAALCFWNRYVSILREQQTNGPSERVKIWLNDLQSKSKFLRTKKDSIADKLVKHFEEFSKDLALLEKERRDLNAKIESAYQAYEKELKEQKKLAMGGGNEVEIFQDALKIGGGIGLLLLDDTDDSDSKSFRKDLASDLIFDGGFGLFSTIAVNALRANQQEYATKLKADHYRNVYIECNKQFDESIQKRIRSTSEFLSSQIGIDLLDVRESIGGKTLLQSKSTALNQLEAFAIDRVTRLDEFIGRKCPIGRIEKLAIGQFNKSSAAKYRELAKQAFLEAQYWPAERAFDMEVAETLDLASRMMIEAAWLEGDNQCWRDMYSIDGEHAVRIADLGLTIFPESITYDRRLVRILSLFVSGNLERAEKETIKLEPQLGKVPDFVFLRGRIRCASGRMSQGIDDLETAISLGYRNIEVARNAKEFQAVQGAMRERLNSLTRIAIDVQLISGYGSGFGFGNGAAPSSIVVTNRSPFNLTGVDLDLTYKSVQGGIGSLRPKKTDVRITNRFASIPPGKSVQLDFDPQQVAIFDQSEKRWANLRLRTDRQGGKSLDVK